MYHSTTFSFLFAAVLQAVEPSPLPPPPAPSSVSKEKAVEARDEMRWMKRIPHDYPSQALREEMEGVVGVSVVVGENGRTESCSVIASSGYQILDEAACKGMMRYARFNPALNMQGDAIRATFKTKIAYRLN